MTLFGEGKIDLIEGVSASEQLMRAELTLSHTRENEIALTSAHLSRVRALINMERHDGFVPHHDTEGYIAEAEFRISKCRERLARLRSSK
jgi:hypothetical protein